MVEDGALVEREREGINVCIHRRRKDRGVTMMKGVL
jgi:hypothetical protein